jgi:hypothetical protein
MTERRKLIAARDLKAGDRIIDKHHGVWTVLNLVRDVHRDPPPRLLIQAQGYISGYGRLWADFRPTDSLLIED